MKASTLFGMTAALVIGLGVLVGARYTGFFDAAPPPEKKNGNGTQILVAARNLIRGTAALPGDGKVRPLLDSERDFYEKFKSKLLSPVANAVEFRVLVKNVPAGQPLLEEYFEPSGLPEPLTARLEPGMRSVSLLLSKENAAGGLLRTGERVDVLLTSVVRSNPGCRDCQPVAPFTATAIIARNLKIVVKRDTLLTVMAPVPEDKPVSYMLEANTYRAALIEFAKGKGKLTLTPSASPMPTGAGGATSSDPDSREYRDEDKRIQEFSNNELIVTDADLERIFNLRSRPLPPAPVAENPRKVEMMVGLRVADTLVIQNGEVTSIGPGKKSPPPPPVRSTAPLEPAADSAFQFSTVSEPLPAASSFIERKPNR